MCCFRWIVVLFPLLFFQYCFKAGRRYGRFQSIWIADTSYPTARFIATNWKRLLLQMLQCIALTEPWTTKITIRNGKTQKKKSKQITWQQRTLKIFLWCQCNPRYQIYKTMKCYLCVIFIFQFIFHFPFFGLKIQHE